MSTCEDLFPLDAMAINIIPISHFVPPFLHFYISISRMASSVDDTYQKLEELMLVLDSSQIAIYLDVK